MDTRPSENELKARLLDASSRVRVGATYKHYKDRLYTVTGLAIIEGTNEVGVIYVADYGERLSFIRPLGSWLQTVHQDGLDIPRFTKI